MLWSLGKGQGVHGGNLNLCLEESAEAEDCATEVLLAYPESVELSAWVIACLRKLGKYDAAKSTLDTFTKNMDAEEVEMLMEKLDAIAVSSAETKLIDVRRRG